MSDRFVSGGTIGGSAGEEKTTSADSAPSVSSGTKNAAQWEAVERSSRRSGGGARSSGGRPSRARRRACTRFCRITKAAFEEQSRLKNQFRALDDDEIEFLDEVRQKKRKEEEAVKRATEEGLRAFRAAQKGSGASVGAGTEKVEEPVMETESWGVGRKRKRLKEREVKGLKKKASGVEDKKEEGQGDSDQKHAVDSKRKEDEKPSMKPQSLPEKQEKPSLGLVGYGSDSDED
uniref:FAM192A/Fyv6 N-terminal domain-containing protein n=1 Tax=Bionectria ochroleuca TaxID=29856 RepID=A0A8H7NCU8_BIOOC